MNQFVSTFDASPDQPVTEIPALDLQNSTYKNPEEWFFEAVGGRMSGSGVRVNPDTALGHGAVWQAVNILAGDFGQLPMRVMQRDDKGGNREKPDHPVDWLLNVEPNELQTPDLFQETMLLWALLWGNGIAAIIKRGGRVEQLVPLQPDRTHYEVIEGTYVIINMTKEDEAKLYFPDEVLHIRGLATNGIWGKSAVQVAREVIGIGLAAQKYEASTFRNGGRPSGVIKHAGELSQSAKNRMRAEWERRHNGPDNANRVAILTEGAEFIATSMSNRDAQTMELLKLDREFVASLFNLPAYKLNALENAAVRANVEEQGREYYQSSLARWANRFRKEIHRKLFTPQERRSRKLWVKVETSVLTSGSEDARMTRAAKGRHAKLLTQNEARELVGRNPVAGGDEFENPATSSGKQGSDVDPKATDGTLDERKESEEMKNLKDENRRLKEAVATLTK